MKASGHVIPLPARNALQQSTIAVILMAGFPVLSIIYIGLALRFHPEDLPVVSIAVVVVSTLLFVLSGFLMLLKFPINIIKLRTYISDVAKGVLPDQICLLDTNCSDDLQYIENGLNIVLREMRQRIALAEQNQRQEHALREQIEQQQRTLVHAERHRAMIQSLGAACHHIGQPAGVLRMRLCLMKKIVNTNAESVQIEECEKDIAAILNILDRLRTVSEFRTEPYIDNDGFQETEILAI